MLDSTTRKRIDDCRDILVGKLPDPKAQIEQITIGLIYKFMDDMDKEAIELGGKPKFFSNFTLPDPDHPEDRSKDKLVQFEQYRWDNLFNSKVTASEMLRLYSEAIENMEKNPNIPQLFRDIFNNAYLPYRDPETLKMFLKTIGEFEYTHSEKLGDAFEYLLQVMGSQGDAGQFRTPRHIIDFLVAILDPGKNDKILDPACGTAGFLISAYKHILLKNAKANEKGLDIYSFNNKNDKPPFNNLGDNLTPDQKKKLVQNFAGYDISPDMVRLSLVNLYLHGFPDPHIHEYDTLSSEARWKENFDVILANPPFMSPKGGIRPHKKFTINSKRSEVLFVDYIAEHLNPKGRAGIIVPEGVIFQSGTAYKELRKMLVENYLYGVVSLPAGVFNPYSGVKTSILLLDAEIAKKSKEVLFIKIENDGYNLGAQRTAVKGGQLEEAIITTKAFKKAVLDQQEFENTSIAHSVDKAEIAKNGEYNLTGERYKIVELIKSDFPLVQLPEVCDINPEILEPSALESEAFYYIDISSIENGTGKVIYDNLVKKKDAPSRAKRQIQKGDVLLSTVRPNLKAFGYIEDPKPNSIASTGFAVLRTKKTLHPKFLLYNLFNDGMVSQMVSMMGKGAYPSINKSDVSSLKIPLPPVSIQEEIVAEIESYQKIIDGAKAVVENYKPKIEIDPEWEMYELGQFVTFNQTGLVKNKSQQSDEFDYPYLKMDGITYDGQLKLDKLVKVNATSEELEKYSLQPEDFLYNTRNTPDLVGKSTVFDEINFRCLFNNNIMRIRFNEKLNPFFANFILNSENYKSQIRSFVDGTTSVAALYPKNYFSIKIPVPVIEVQNRIVDLIKKEQDLIKANKHLIEIFEQKINDRISKVWGE